MDGLRVLRILYLSLLSGPLLLLVVLFIVMDEVGTPNAPVGLAALAAGVAGFGGALWASRRPLAAGDDGALAVSYRTNFFLGFALAEAGLLITFVLAFIERAVWPYLIGLPFFLAGMALVAPTDRNLDRRQQELMHSGSSLSLAEALRTAPPA